jgi:D-alanyl-D-alanine carboxypeptidase
MPPTSPFASPSSSPSIRPQRAVFSPRTVLLIAGVGAIIVLLTLILPRLWQGADTGSSESPVISWALLAPPIGPEDGAIPTTSVVDVYSDLPAITQLDPELRAALESATVAAGRDGQALHITSGWRSTRYQEKLLSDAVSTYGGEDAAREFVATPETSSHVTGKAVDIGPLNAQLWLMEHGSAYGLCQMFINERWHFELVTAPGNQCPDMLTDASHL